LLDVINAEKEKFIYEYDFGDSWKHVILVEKILSNDPKIKYPVCIKGKRACPPEDCGGIWGYYDFLEVIQNPDHPEYNEMSEWWDAGEFDPEAFDLDKVNMRLKSNT
ncbi:MAG: plasmid pRiA4b ORF-3 family protein, partial [Desulfobulbaceae bacterium]|nr:plasmid pRiA4b ORF-3 family protein [Desulfobulbaceae bacterium]